MKRVATATKYENQHVNGNCFLLEKALEQTHFLFLMPPQWQLGNFYQGHSKRKIVWIIADAHTALKSEETGRRHLCKEKRKSFTYVWSIRAKVSPICNSSGKYKTSKSWTFHWRTQKNRSKLAFQITFQSQGSAGHFLRKMRLNCGSQCMRVLSFARDALTFFFRS